MGQAPAQAFSKARELVSALPR